MAFSDPQSITINAVANSLPRIQASTEGRAGIFQKDDGNLRLSIQSTTAKTRVRRNIRVDQRKIAADPLLTGVSVPYSMSCYLVVDIPKDAGYTIAEQKQVVDGFLAYLSASSGAKITQFLGGEGA